MSKFIKILIFTISTIVMIGFAVGITFACISVFSDKLINFYGIEMCVMVAILLAMLGVSFVGCTIGIMCYICRLEKE